MFSNTQRVLGRALSDGAFPSFAAAVGDRENVLFRIEMDGPDRPANSGAARLFDMASLTKLMATTTIALRLISRGEIRFDDPISRFFDTPSDKSDITIDNLLRHTGGFEAHFLLEQITSDPSDAMSAILSRPLVYGPGTKCIYSCIGFIVLGKLLEKVTDTDLDLLADTLVFTPLAMDVTCYNPKKRKKLGEWKAYPTEYDTIACQPLRGVVHDENARFLNGISGNAGLFSSIDDCILFARFLLSGNDGFLSRDLHDSMGQDMTPGMAEARGRGTSVWRDGVPWSAGNMLGKGAFGHTGFTGTSIFVSPAFDIYFILLTNRVNFGREVAIMPNYRSDFHRAVLQDLGR